MVNRFEFSRFALLLCVALLLFPFLSGASRAQESSGTPSLSTPPVMEAKPGLSQAMDGSARKSDVAFLTREYAGVSASQPLLTEKVEVPNTSFIRELYRAEWRTQDPFYFYVIRPKGVSKPPVILYLPSFPSDLELFKNNSWCDVAVRGGYATVGFVGNVTGHRTRYRLLKEWFVSQMPEALTSTTHDVQLILDYLSTRGDLDMNRVAMFGNGSGASIAILASVVDSRIKVLDLQAPWGDWKDWLSESKVISDEERPNFLKAEFLEKVTPLDPVAWIPKIQARSLRIEDIRGNKAMPDKAQEKLEAAAPDFAIINQYGNGRAFLATQVQIATLDWVKSQLAPDAKPPAPMEKSARIHIFPALPPPPPPSSVQSLGNSATPQVASAPAPAKEKEKERENPR